MINIAILTTNLPTKRGFNDFFPLFKWRNEIFRAGIQFNYFSSLTKHIDDNDILIIDYRFFQHKVIGRDFLDESYIIEIIDIYKSKKLKVILFDTADSTGSRCFGITPYVDLHLKKQLLKDKDLYTQNKGDKSLMCWIPEKYTPSNIPYKACRPEDLDKLKIGWNIGMVDYRQFPLQEYYPLGTSLLLNRIYKKPIRYIPGKNKTLLTSYRGRINSDTRYSYQRMRTLEIIKNVDFVNEIQSGVPIKKKKYLSELARSKAIISPFGWGEICYRDFETFIYGAILVKPSVAHLTTFPNFFIENETYLPVAWDLSDLQTTLISIRDNYNDFLNIATQGQTNYYNIITNPTNFLEHFKKTIL